MDLYYDPYDYDVDVNVQVIWKRLRDEAPLYWNDKYEFFALSRFDDVLEAMLDLETFQSSHATTIELMTDEPQQIPMMIWMDPPMHTAYRKLVNRAFTNKRIGDLEARLTALVGRMLDDFVGSKGFDFVDDLGALVPPTMILALLGFPEGHESDWRKGVDRMFHMEQGEAGFRRNVTAGTPEELTDPDQGLGAVLFKLLPDMVEQRRNDPQEDLVSTLVHTEIELPDGTVRKLNEMEIFSFVQMIAIAGTETVARHLGWVAVLLDRYPDQRAELADDPGLIPNAIEEILRYEAPSPVNARWVSRDVEFHGETVPRGSKLILLNGSGNRDERHFPDPDRFDIHRKIDRHLSFGYGAHFCIGAALARLEAQVTLREALKRFPTWEVDHDGIEWVHTSTVRGFAKVPISVS